MIKTLKLQRIFVLLILIASPILASTTCNKNEDCSFLHNCESGICVHKEIFPISVAEILMTFIFVILLTMTNIGGIGGGSPTLAILIILWGFDVKLAVPISITMVLGAIVANFIINVRMRDPAKLPLIRFDVDLVIVPSIIEGTLIGLILNKIAPNIVILVVLVVLLSYVLKKILVRAWNLRKTEKQQQLEAMKNINDDQIKVPQTDGALKSEENQSGQVQIELPFPNLPSPTYNTHQNFDAKPGSQNESKYSSSNTNQIEKKEKEIEKFEKLPQSEAQAIIDDPQAARDRDHFDKLEKAMFPIRLIWPLGLLWIIILVLNMVKGSGRLQSIVGLSYCETEFWLIEASQHITCLIFFFIMKFRVQWMQKRKKEIGYLSNFGFELDSKSINKIGFFSIFGGALVGLCSTSSGNVVTTLLLSLGITPERSAKTASFAEMFSVATSFILNVMSGAITPYKVAWFLPIVLCGVFSLATILNRIIVVKYKRLSWILWSICAACALVIILVPAYSIPHLISDPDAYLSPKSVC
eukprot:TRINITY_DN5087_c0_g1_i5.p1 TRINITY_DN5087_c0_g1~~TRINITY_DN5087_c0_g1_i5.p1  ORF type:complete len:527 (+),score=77.96 TRINITY_DN5087_c0_g1_i5:71-1651(+)